MKEKRLSILPLFIAMALIISCAPKQDVDPSLLEGPGWTEENNNLHLMEGPPPGPDAEDAFRVYRSGAPSKETFAKWCEVYHIERVIDMAGSAPKNEMAFQEEGICPGIEIVYSKKQDPNTPVSDSFIEFFEDEIEQARQDQVGILFRCTTGSHRAGRMAAYYQMKYQGLTAEEAIAVMDYNGMMMYAYDWTLRPQVRAMEDYIQGKECEEAKMFCVAEDSNRYMPKN